MRKLLGIIAYLTAMAPSVAEEENDDDKDSAHKNHQNAEEDDDIDPRR